MRKKNNIASASDKEISLRIARGESKTDWARVKAMSQAEVERLADDEEGPLPEGWEGTIESGGPESRNFARTKADKTDRVSADKPITNPDRDKLGCAPFAQHLAERILTAADPEGLVIALHGEWGSGKTSLLNMIVFYLLEREKKEQPIVVTFNPWWFSSHEDLARRFFESLRAGFSGGSRVGQTLRSALSGLGQIVAHFPDERISALGKAATELAKTKPTVPVLKDKISEQLRSLGKPVVVTIDDVDRLTFEEIRQVFRVVKAVANFPNVIYLMAFDRQIVGAALSESTGKDGDSFLEKIVQVPIQLPVVDRVALQRMLFAKLDELAPTVSPDRFNTNHWANVFFDGIEPLLRTPRDVVRLINALRFTYPAVREEVNFVDFVALEALRVFCSPAYELIRDNPNKFLRPSSSGSNGKEQSVTNLLGPVVSQIPSGQAQAVAAMVTRLFPRLERGYSSEFESTWRKEGRVCSPDRFPIYFRLSLPVGDISDSEMRSLLSAAKDPKDFGVRLIRFSREIRPDETSRASMVLERLPDYTQTDIPLPDAANIVKALFDVGDLLHRDEDKDQRFFGIGNEIRIGRIIYQLLRHFDELERLRILSDSAREGRAIGMIAYQTCVFGQEHGKHGSKQPTPEPEQLLSASHLKELEELAVQRIQQAASDGSLLKVPHLGHLLSQWRDLGGGSDAADWVKRVTNEDDVLVRFLEGFLSSVRTQTLGDRMGRQSYRLDPEWVRPYIHPDVIIERVRKILETREDLSDRQKTALGEFIREYELRQSGGNPDDPLATILRAQR